MPYATDDSAGGRHMHVVIGGYGRVGRFLAHMLEADGHTVAVIDHSPVCFEEIDDISGQKFDGEVFDREALTKAGIQRADCFAAVTSGDNSNIVSARIARETFGVANVLARIYDPRRAELYRELGIRTISSVEWASSRLLDMITRPGVPSECRVGGGEVDMVQVTVGPAGNGRRVADAERAGESRIASIVHEGVARVPEPDMTLAEGDRLYAAVALGSFDSFKQLLGME
jgi:trk system potassium uptake protein